MCSGSSVEPQIARASLLCAGELGGHQLGIGPTVETPGPQAFTEGA